MESQQPKVTTIHVHVSTAATRSEEEKYGKKDKLEDDRKKPDEKLEDEQQQHPKLQRQPYLLDVDYDGLEITGSSKKKKPIRDFIDLTETVHKSFRGNDSNKKSDTIPETWKD